MKFDIFLSHQGDNKSEIIQLAEYLEPDITCWYAPRNILESKNYGTEVLTGIEDSKIFLVFLTEKFETNPENYVTNEVVHARSHKKRIIPVIKGRSNYPRELEMHLNSYQWFNFNDYDTVEEAWQQLRIIIQLLLTDKNDSLNAENFLSHVKNRAIHIPEGFSQASENLLNKHKHVFIPTTNFLKISSDDTITVFYGKEGEEKTTHAINFLMERNMKFIFEGLSIDSLKALSAEPLHEDAGYFIHIDHSDLNRMMTESFLENLSERLKKAGALLVLCTDEPVKFFESIEIPMPSDRSQFLLKHLSWTVKDTDKLQEAQEILMTAPNAVIIHEIDNIGTLHELVRQLSLTINQEQSLEQFTESLRYLSLEQSPLPFDLDSSDNINDILYSLVIALNHGKSYEIIIDSYELLLSEFQKAYPAQQINYHTRSFSTLKRDFHLKIVNERVTNHLGSYAEECIYYQNGLVADKIWTTVWSEYPYREYLSDVLIKHLGSKYSSVVSRVEDIMFAIIDSGFEQGIERLITPLAKSNKLSENLMAKRLLLRLYDDPKYKLKTIRLLKNWIVIRNKRLERTALLTLQSKIGIENYQNTLDWLLELLFRNRSYSNTHYLTFAYLSKYVFLDPQLEKTYYGILKGKLVDWRGQDVYMEYLKLLSKTIKNNTPMYFKSDSTFIESFLVFIIVYFIEQEDYKSPASTLFGLLTDIDSYPNGKELYKALLLKLKTKLNTEKFNNLIDTVKKGEQNVPSL